MGELGANHGGQTCVAAPLSILMSTLALTEVLMPLVLLTFCCPVLPQDVLPAFVVLALLCVVVLSAQVVVFVGAAGIVAPNHCALLSCCCSYVVSDKLQAAVLQSLAKRPGWPHL